MSFILGAFIGAFIGFFLAAVLSAAGEETMTMHGKWRVIEHNEHLNIICSNCNEDFYVYKKGQYRIDRSKYCPNCGAKMDLK